MLRRRGSADPGGTAPSEGGRHSGGSTHWWALLAAGVLLGLPLGATLGWQSRQPAEPAPPTRPPKTSTAAEAPTVAGAPVREATARPASPAWADPAAVGSPYSPTVPGMLTFRGNPTRTYHGRGPVPSDPRVAWRYPAAGLLCGDSTVAGRASRWCGTGWTGQPAVFQRDGRTWVVFGALDHRVHFLDGDTGEQLLPSFVTGDIIKGSVTVDPDGYPLVYVGSRDNRYRVLAIDRAQPTELWSLHAEDTSPTLWNNDWDGAGLVLDDYLFVGGENSRFHIVRLHRGYDPAGQVTVTPELVFDAAGWDEQLLADLGDSNVSIESSVAISGDTVYFANSGGLVQGWDIAGLRAGREPRRVFRFWTGDDTDATVVVDEDGMLYVASEWERHTPRARALGQIFKLDPSRPHAPVLWSFSDQVAGPAGEPGAAGADRRPGSAGAMPGPPAPTEGGGLGVWATPALHGDAVYVATNAGRLLALDRADGTLRWAKQLQGPTWSSPVVVDDTLIQADCGGALYAFDVADPAVEPPLLWSVQLGGCIESTPTVWDGAVYVGTKAGQFAALRDG